MATLSGTGGMVSATSGRGRATSLSRGVGVSGGMSVAGDLELFLMGLHLSELIPNFHHHKVEFSQLLSMTDYDLQSIGIDKVGVAKGWSYLEIFFVRLCLSKCLFVFW